jgi:hypothetical protein
VPDAVLRYIGETRDPQTPAERVLEQVGLEKLMSSSGYFSDFDPLVVVLELVTVEIEALGLSPRGPKGGAVWIEVVSAIQDPHNPCSTGHNRFIPCRTCDRAFLPDVDVPLRRAFLAWHRTRKSPDLVAIHRCARCGGSIKELEAKTYGGDSHTPGPGFAGTDEEWSEELLEACSI